MFKQHRHKILSAFTVVSLCLSSPFFVTRNSWAQQPPEPETAALTQPLQLKSQDVKQRLGALNNLDNSLRHGKAQFEVVVPAMIAALKDPNARVRQQSASYLADYLAEDPVPSVQAAILPLIAALKDPNKDVRQEAAEALGNRGNGNVPAKLNVPALIAALKDPSKGVRKQAAMSLGWIGAPAQSAVPTLIALLKHSNTDMRYAAANALGQIFDQIRTPAQDALLKHSNSDTGMQKEAVNALISAVAKDPDEGVQREAANALTGMGALPQDIRNYMYGCGIRPVY